MKNFAKLVGIIALVAVIGFSFASCDIDNNGDDDDNSKGTLPAGTYNGVAVETYDYTAINNSNLQMRAFTVLQNLTSPSLVINSNGTVVFSIGGGGTAFLNTTASTGAEWKYVNANNTITFQYKPLNGEWTNYNGSTQATTIANGQNFVQTLTGLFNETTGKITLTCTISHGGESTSRTYEFTKQ